ncbi:hypothetical protein AM493_17080 [Flavobacterium akiainvivens]|uniref:Nucleotidyltransferase n=2 Tax=Flavobacterium akiainvivens TaxID=1202724 RepID=A0A0M8MBB9_9FLAO|nr:hypothetical protein AM493_17080 [Flavobacterium akiainvivens]SFQ77804.1 Nucleotidyl transferase AbiEii toxin, Type IV TA system [Flavobacterium akiainvivens]
MLHKNTVSPAMWELMQRLMKDEVLKDFVLVGGTALSLKIGHRLSVDIDLFRQDGFDVKELRSYLESYYKAQPTQDFENSVMTFIDDIKVDLISHQYRYLKPVETIEGIRLVSLEDIGAMKLLAIAQSGRRIKDFVDMYYLLEHNPLVVYLEGYAKKYGANPVVARNAVNYFKNVSTKQIMEYFPGKKEEWEKTMERLWQAKINIRTLFEPVRKEENDIKPGNNKRRGLRM